MTEQTETNVVEINSVALTDEDAQAIAANIEASFPSPVSASVTTFNFRKGKDDAGREVIRHPVDLVVPYPSLEGIIAILEGGGKGLDLLNDAVQAVVNAQVRAMLTADTTIDAGNLDTSKLSWEAIANMPKPQRGGGIPKELWDDFVVDFIEVMQEAAGKTVEQATTAAKLCKAKFVPVKTVPAVLNVMTEQLAIYSEHTSKIADFGIIVEFLVEKIDTFLNIKEEDLLANL